MICGGMIRANFKRKSPQGMQIVRVFRRRPYPASADSTGEIKNDRSDQAKRDENPCKSGPY